MFREGEPFYFPYVLNFSFFTMLGFIVVFVITTIITKDFLEVQ